MAVTETPRQTLSVLRRHSSCRARRCGAPHTKISTIGAVLLAENRLARLNFCRDVLQRVGVLAVRGKRHLKPLDLTRVVFSDEKFFRWNYTGPAQNNPIWVVGFHGRTARKADLDPDASSKRVLRINAECHIRMLDDVYLPSWWWQEDNAPSHTSRHTKAFLKECDIQLLTWSFMLARPQPNRFSPVASVGNGTGRAPVPVSARTARHDRAHTVRSRPRSR